MSKNNSPRLVNATETSFAIVETVRDLDDATLTDVVEKLDIGYSTAHNHLATLCANDWLVEHDGEYDIGLKFLSFGEYARRRTPHYDVARRHMHKLTERTNLEVEFLVEEYGRLISIVDMIGDAGGFGPSEDGKWLRVGEYYYLHNTASGKAILAELPDERVEEILDQWGLPVETPYSVTDRDELDAQLATIREQGYAETEQEVVEGFANAGTAVQYPDGRVLGGISVGWPTYLYSDGVDPEVIEQLLDTAASIEEQLAVAASD